MKLCPKHVGNCRELTLILSRRTPRSWAGGLSRAAGSDCKPIPSTVARQHPPSPQMLPPLSWGWAWLAKAGCATPARFGWSHQVAINDSNQNEVFHHWQNRTQQSAWNHFPCNSLFNFFYFLFYFFTLPDFKYVSFFNLKIFFYVSYSAVATIRESVKNQVWLLLSKLSPVTTSFLPPVLHSHVGQCYKWAGFLCFPPHK